MPITSSKEALPEGIKLTKRQREVWERTHGLNGFEQMRAQEIAKDLGISANSVYVTRRRVKQAIEAAGGPVATDGRRKQQPKSIRRVSGAGLDDVATVLRTKLETYDDEERQLRERLDQIGRERPAINVMLEQLSNIEDRDAVAA